VINLKNKDNTRKEELIKLGNNLLLKHRELGKKLRQIPQQRKMNVNISTRDGLSIAKPRFNKRKYSWDASLLENLLNHLQEIWNFLQNYYYYFDEKVISFIHKDYRRSSKDSIIFLLERDVWETDEVYGDYLVERKRDKIIVSYYRREERRKTFELSIMPDEELKKWIMDDAKNQIISAFNYKWGLLETEIDTCANGLHIREVSEPITDEELLCQASKIKELLKIDIIAAMLSLGRIVELWCVLLLSQKEKEIKQNLIQDLKEAKKIDEHQARLLNQIRIKYNSIKHKSDFRLKEEEVVSLYNAFCDLLRLNEK